MTEFVVQSYNPTPPGGQQVGISSAVKVTHEPSGLFAVSGAERSQHRNRRIAQAMVEYGLAELGWKGDKNA
jgi:peptide chain release factor